MNLVKFSVGDVIELKKNHPCGGNTMTVLYSGSDIKLKCNIHTSCMPFPSTDEQVSA